MLPPSVSCAVRHPAKYTDVILSVMAEMLRGAERVLDPFAGTGKLRKIVPNAYLIEIEPEWAAIGGARVGDALCLSEYFKPAFFDAVATSPSYANRLADHFTDHQEDKHYIRNTYRHALGRPLHPHNSGAMQWGTTYQLFHQKAWKECWTVLKEGGRFVLNISDHIREGKVVPVTEWHIETLKLLGFRVADWRKVETPRQKFGANRNKRVGYESVICLMKS